MMQENIIPQQDRNALHEKKTNFELLGALKKHSFYKDYTNLFWEQIFFLEFLKTNVSEF